MNKDIEQLNLLIKDYQEKVYQAVNLLNSKSQKEPGFQAKSRAGVLDDFGTITYLFHGSGCFVKFSDSSADFDFGDEGRCDGIDIGFLVDFLENKRDKYPLLND